MPKPNLEIIDFVKKTTEAITIISEATRQNAETLGAVKQVMDTQNINSAKSFEQIDGKMDGLLTMFKYVIVPLIGGILSLVGIKYLFKI